MERTLELYYWHKQHGICVSCCKRDAEKGVCCLECWGERQRNKKEIQKKYRAKNSERLKQYQKQLRDKRKERHECIYCERSLPSWEKRVSCEMCRFKQNKRAREKTQREGRVPQFFRGDGEHCAICCKPVEEKGRKLCARCYSNCLSNLARTAPEARERSKQRFRELNTIYWNEVKQVKHEREADQIE